MTSSRQTTKLPQFAALNRYGAVDAGLRAVMLLVAGWIVKARSRRKLASLDDRILKDIGVSPEEAMRAAAERIAQGGRVAVMFGPERAGLENADVAQANAIISVPVNPEFPSLNLAQCVLLCGYEWRRASAGIEARRDEMAGAAWASGIEVEKLAEHYEQRLEEAGFFFPDHKAPAMKLTLRNLWSRMPLTSEDVRTLHGILRQMVRWKERG